MSKRSFIRDFIGVLNSNIFSILFGVLVVVLLTNILGSEGFGLYYALIVVPIIVMSITHMGIRGASLFLMGKKTYPEKDLVSAVITILLFTGSAGIILSLIAYYFLGESNYTNTIIALVVIIIPFRLGIIYLSGIYYGMDEIKLANRFEWSINLLNLLIAIILVWQLKMGLLGAVISLTVANVLVGIYAMYTVVKRYNISINLRSGIIVHLLRLGILFAFTFFIIQLNYRIDILLLEKLSTISQVGIYSLGVHIAEQLWMVPFAISVVLFSRTANLTDQSKIVKSSITLARQSFILVLILSVLIIILAPYLVPLVFGDDFVQSARILTYILPGVVIMVIYRVLSGHLEGIGKPQYAIYAFAPALFINIILNYVLIPKYGAIGAAIASNISYVIGTLVYWIIFSRITNTGLTAILMFRRDDIVIFVRSLKSLISK